MGPAIVGALVIANLVIAVWNDRRYRRIVGHGNPTPRQSKRAVLLTGVILVAAELGLNMIRPHLGDMAVAAVVVLGLGVWVFVWLWSARAGR